MFGKIKSITITMFLTLALAAGIASISSAAELLVSSAGANSAQRYSLTGTNLGQLAPYGIYDTEPGPDGNYYMGNAANIFRYEPGTGTLTAIAGYGGLYIKWANGILWAGNGANLIGMDTTGAVVYNKAWGGTAYDVALGGDGRLYAGNYNTNQVIAWDYAGTGTTEVISTTFQPLSVVVNGNDIYANDPWTAIEGGAGAIYKISKVDGVWTTSLFAAPHTSTNGMAIYGGKLYCAMHNLAQVNVYDLATGNLDSSFSTIINPQGLAIVPEPASLVAMLSGLVGLAGAAIRRRK